MKNILAEICHRRLEDIKKTGYSYGHQIPQNRTRPVVPFLPHAGTILEVKRASPSKGDIAPDLNPVETAENYINAGTSAISVLTEENYFKGSLEDLKKVCQLADKMGNKTAVLRKDFLLEPEEIEVAYKCGADAVLLIAKILDTQKLLQMAQKAFQLGISILLELRDQEAVLKAVEVLKIADKMNAHNQIVLGVNARDLKTFKIDMLIPLKIKNMIQEELKKAGIDCTKVKVISESGILNPDAAFATGAMGFDGILIGEACAKNPASAINYVNSFLDGCSEYSKKKNSFWSKISEKINIINNKNKVLVKICGITNIEDALTATENGAHILGFIAEKKFSRHVDLDKVEAIKKEITDFCLKNSTPVPLFVAVITTFDTEESKKALHMQELGIFDGIQFHGFHGIEFHGFHGIEQNKNSNIHLGYEAFRIGDENQLSELESKYIQGWPRVLIDAYDANQQGGTGKQIPSTLVEKCGFSKLWLAGGITPENVKQIIQNFNPELIDVSSGVEIAPGKKDKLKIQKLFQEINNLHDFL